MPARKLPPFAEWQRPWADGEFDEDRAAKRVYDLLSDKGRVQDERDELRTKVTELEGNLEAATAKLESKPGEESAKDARITELQAKVNKLEREGRPTDRQQILRLRAANDFGLTAEDADRLRGETEEDIRTDAEGFAKRLGVVKSEPGGTGEEEGPEGLVPNGPPQGTATPVTQYRTGHRELVPHTVGVRKTLESLPPLE